MSKQIMVVYYSRGGHAKILATQLGAELGCPVEELCGKKSYKGIPGLVKGIYHSLGKKYAGIENIKHNPSDYDAIVAVSPIWAAAMTPPVRTYLRENKENIAKLYLVSVAGSSGIEGMKEETVKEIKLAVSGELALKASQIDDGTYSQQLKEFASNIKDTLSNHASVSTHQES